MLSQICQGQTSDESSSLLELEPELSLSSSSELFFSLFLLSVIETSLVEDSPPSAVVLEGKRMKKLSHYDLAQLKEAYAGATVTQNMDQGSVVS